MTRSEKLLEKAGMGELLSKSIKSYPGQGKLAESMRAVIEASKRPPTVLVKRTPGFLKRQVTKVRGWLSGKTTGG